MLAENAVRRHKLAVHVLSTANGGAAEKLEDENIKICNQPQIITDVTAFKSCHGMYPLAQPYINIIRKGNRCKL